MKKLLFTAFAAIVISGCSNDLDDLPCISCGTTSGTPVSYGGETYQTVVIGVQTWMARNLNYDASGSVCYDNSTANCAKYGRLYDWATAMALPEECNREGCSDLIETPHQGICPSGWHIPSNADWDALIAAAGGGDMAGLFLKATSGWSEGGNGLGIYGFSALPGGDGGSGGYFGNVGNYGYWWSSSEYYSIYACYRSMSYGSESVYYDFTGKYFLYSVRCLQD
ncbi:MAG: hypothetical protein LBC75_06480 [Fibromonadaceae bacterium]|jgi:uncharacterized protein (TIGR02145 family)|nr:hypothetical protein [Fibromonadaceae bacterium]